MSDSERSDNELDLVDDSDHPEVEVPQLDPTGQTQQRTVEQNKKQEDLVKQVKRKEGSYSNQSRSQSRRARRKRIQGAQQDGKYMHTASLTALEEADANGEAKEMQPFERIGPDSTSMDGPVTKARADRGEIPVRGTNGRAPYYKTPPAKQKGKLEDTDGLKLSLEANLDVEIELKASIRGDLTLSLFA